MAVAAGTSDRSVAWWREPTKDQWFFPTEVRSTASGFCYGFGGAVGSFVPMIISYLAIEQQMGFAVPLLLTTTIGSLSIMLAALLGPETKGKVFTADPMTEPAPLRLVGAPEAA